MLRDSNEFVANPPGAGPTAVTERPAKAIAIKKGWTRAALLGACGFVLLSAVWCYFPGLFRARTPLVVYCTQDSRDAESILRDFEKRTGIPVSARFDTKVPKSTGLINQLIPERDHPRCDVVWTDEPLGTMQLKQAGVLEPYRGSGFTRIPEAYKDPDGYWTGFSARMRVYIVNTRAMAATENSISQALGNDLPRFVLTKPLDDTTLVHYSLLWKVWGAERLKSWHREVRRRGAQEVAGNAVVVNLVAQGACDFGWTDTDEFFAALDEGQPVAMLPVRVGEGYTICIPNTVAIIKGTQRTRDARRLVDFLLSARTELALARSKTRQIPLGPVTAGTLPEEVQELRDSLKTGTDLFQLDHPRKECLQWLRRVKSEE